MQSDEFPVRDLTVIPEKDWTEAERVLAATTAEIRDHPERLVRRPRRRAEDRASEQRRDSPTD